MLYYKSAPNSEEGGRGLRTSYLEAPVMIVLQMTSDISKFMN